jgi:hypothetical protein
MVPAFGALITRCGRAPPPTSSIRPTTSLAETMEPGVIDHFSRVPVRGALISMASPSTMALSVET